MYQSHSHKKNSNIGYYIFVILTAILAVIAIRLYLRVRDLNDLEISNQQKIESLEEAIKQELQEGLSLQEKINDAKDAEELAREQGYVYPEELTSTEETIE